MLTDSLEHLQRSTSNAPTLPLLSALPPHVEDVGVWGGGVPQNPLWPLSVSLHTGLCGPTQLHHHHKCPFWTQHHQIQPVVPLAAPC